MNKDKLRELVHKYNELDREIYEMEVERQLIKDYLRDDPVASYRPSTVRYKAIMEVVEGEKKIIKKRCDKKLSIMSLYNSYGEIPATITRKQAGVLLMGRGIKPVVLDVKGKVRTTYIIDELADSFGMSEQEFLDHLESIHSMQEKYDMLDGDIAEAKNKQKDLGVNVGHHVYAAPTDSRVRQMVALSSGMYILSRFKGLNA